jgi:hypothetical protein
MPDPESTVRVTGELLGPNPNCMSLRECGNVGVYTHAAGEPECPLQWWKTSQSALGQHPVIAPTP